MRKKFGLATMSLCAIAACGGSVMSSSRLVASEGSVRGAQEVGAQRVPRAGLHLKLAQEEIIKARTASEQGEGATADRWLGRAQADADLAIALSNEAAAEQAASTITGKAEDASAKAKEIIQ